MMFPAICIAAFSVDLIFASSQIIASGSVGREHQGVAGSLIGTLLSYGLSTGLGFAGTIETQTNRSGQDILRGYRAALFFAVGLGGVGFIGSLLFLRIKRILKKGGIHRHGFMMNQRSTLKPQPSIRLMLVVRC